MGMTHILPSEVNDVGDDLKAFMDELRADSRAAGLEADLDAYLGHFDLARQVQELRAARRLTQTALARSARVPQSEISRLETGRGNPTLQTLARIAAACGARLLLVPERSTGRAASRGAGGARRTLVRRAAPGPGRGGRRAGKARAGSAQRQRRG